MPLTLAAAKLEVTNFLNGLSIDLTVAQQLTDTFDTKGKVYEAWCLVEALDQLRAQEGIQAVLVSGDKLAFKAGTGPINPNYPHFDLLRNDSIIAKMWTDVEFTSLSSEISGSSSYHELDLLVVDAEAAGRPGTSEIWLGIECKHTKYEKRMLREVLGVRRELSFYTDERPTRFTSWPMSHVNAKPESALLVFSSDPTVESHQSIGAVFGVKFKHLEM